MAEHILYTVIDAETQGRLVRKISDKYGYGADDHAIVVKKNLKAPLFTHELDMMPLWSVRFEEVMRQFDWDYALDDTVLERILPHALQCMRAFCRRPELGWHLNVLERQFLLGTEFFYAYLTHYGIQRVVFFSTPHMGYDLLLYYVCGAMGIPTVIFVPSVIAGRNYLVEKIESPVESFLTRYRQLQTEYADAPLEAIEMAEDYGALFAKLSAPAGDKTPPWGTRNYMQELRVRYETDWLAPVRDAVVAEFRQKGLAAVDLRYLKRCVLALFWQMICLDFKLTHGAVCSKVLTLCSKHWRQNIALHKAYDGKAIPADFSRKYIYFPLHYQPENTSNPMGGGVYYEQAVPIRLLAESLPKDVFVYVKEHPMQCYGERTEAFYDELLMIPNVVLVRSDTDTYALMQNAAAVASLTGTAMREGLFYGKPAIMFGYWVVRHLPGVYHVRTKAECKAAVDEILSGKTHFTLKDLKLAYKAMADTEAYSVRSKDVDQGTEESKCRSLESSLKLYDDYMALHGGQ